MRKEPLIMAALAAGFIAQWTLAQEQKQPAKEGEGKAIIGTVERLDPRFDQLIPKDAQTGKDCRGFHLDRRSRLVQAWQVPALLRHSQ